MGTWNFYYGGCNGSYNQATITFNSDGTFIDSFGHSGHWIRVCGLINFIYGNGASYSGSVVNSAMVGMMMLPDATSSGCWYAIDQSAQTTALTEGKAERTPSGQK